MNKRIFIIHRWDGSPEADWHPWLKRKLESRGFIVNIPAMPESSEPKIEAWVSHLSKIVGNVDENTFFVGHSIGCQTILRYLESLPSDVKVGGAIFVAGWLTLQNLSSDKEREIAKPWLETPIDFEKARQHSNKFVAIFSDNDEFVPLSNKEIFEQRLKAKTILEHNKGHFSDDDGVRELVSVLKTILEISE